MKTITTIGFSITGPKEEGSDIYVTTIVERRYHADVLDNLTKFEASESINDNINLSNKLSIISDPFCTNNIGNIAYVTLLGTKWKIKDVKIQYPRLLLSVGGIYNA